MVKQLRVTRDEVAKRAGVSTAVVSYVMNDGPRPVARETRARVLAAIEELGYVPNHMARSLKLRRSYTVGVVIPDITNPAYAEVAKGMEEIFSGSGNLLLLCDSENDAERERQFVDRLRRRQVDGVVLIPSGDPRDAVRPLTAAGIATVLVEHEVRGLPSLVVDEHAGGRLGTEHLIRLGHRRIGLIRQKPSHRLSRHRFDGYRQALEAHDLVYDPVLVIETEGGAGEAADAAGRLLHLERPPTAIFTHNDVMAVGVLHAVKHAGLQVPQDISVMGYDDITLAAYLSPPLTTVRFPHREIGRRAAQMLNDIGSGQPPERHDSSAVLTPRVIVRGSTTSPPTGRKD